MNRFELNFDGLIGPSHHFGGLSCDNQASRHHQAQISSPKQAALQGLEKGFTLYKMGVPQAILPPHHRPNLQMLRNLGFSGASDQDVLDAAYKQNSNLVSAAFSASSMWTANAATVSASKDTGDGKVHFTPANLLNHLHRSQEARFNQLLFNKIFSDPMYFKVHDPITSCYELRDEGAANHTRLGNYESCGLQIFCHNPLRTGRQARIASEAICRGHCLDFSKVVFLEQNPLAVQKGVFHNDVIATGHKNLYLHHENAYTEWSDESMGLIDSFQQKSNQSLIFHSIKEEEISLEDAIQSYFFNSQIVSTNTEEQVLIAPVECLRKARVKAYIDSILEDSTLPIHQVIYMDLTQSMKNGGGPACLRLRVVLNQDEFNAMHSGVLINEKLYNDLKKCIQRNYRDSLTVSDLRDPQFLAEVKTIHDEIDALLDLGNNFGWDL